MAPSETRPCLGVLVRFYHARPSIESGRGYMTCFGKWDISKQDTSRGLKSTCTLGLALSCHWELTKYPTMGTAQASLLERPCGEQRHLVNCQTCEWGHQRLSSPLESLANCICVRKPDNTYRRTIPLVPAQIVNPQNRDLTECSCLKQLDNSSR